MTGNLEIEQALLGILLFQPSALSSINCNLKADHFSEPFHGALFAEMERRATNGSFYDLNLIASHFAIDQAFTTLGGRSFLLDLVEKAPDVGGASAYAQCVVAEWKARRQREIGGLLAAGQQPGPLLAELNDLEDLGVGSNASRFNFKALSEICLSDAEFIVDRLVPRHGIGFLAGKPGAGKTFAAVDLAMRLSSGFPILDRATERCGVCYLAAEAASGVEKRVKGWQARYRVTDETPFKIASDAPDLRIEADVNALVSKLKSVGKKFEETGVRLGLVVIDTLSASIPGADINTSQDMSTVTKNARNIAEKTGAFVLIVHHVGKDEARGLAGSFVLNASADMVLMLSGGDDDIVKNCKVAKLKEAADGWSFAFKLDEIRFEDSGRTLKTCIPSYVDATEGKPAKAKRVNPKDMAVLQAINLLMDVGPTHAAPAATGVTQGQRAITREQLRERLQQAGFTDGEAWLPRHRTALKDRMMSLQAASKIRIEGDSIWPL